MAMLELLSCTQTSYSLSVLQAGSCTILSTVEDNATANLTRQSHESDQRSIIYRRGAAQWSPDALNGCKPTKQRWT